MLKLVKAEKTDAASIISKTCGHLRQIAAEDQLNFLCHLLAMVQLEAEIHQRKKLDCPIFRG